MTPDAEFEKFVDRATTKIRDALYDGGVSRMKEVIQAHMESAIMATYAGHMWGNHPSKERGN
jgi:hypothetical protein